MVFTVDECFGVEISGLDQRGPTRLELATSGVTGRGRLFTVRAQIPYEPENEGFRAIPMEQPLVV